MPLITLLTDFGTADHYVAEIKGVLLSRAPGVTLVDDPDLLVVNVVNAPTAEELDAEGAGEVTEAEEPAEEAAEAEAAEAESESE